MQCPTLARAASQIARSGLAHRRLSAAAAAAAEDAPKAHGIVGRYAMALYAAASKQGTLDTVAADVAKLQEMEGGSLSFREFLKDPTLPRTAKVETINAVMNRGSFSETFSNFMYVITENGRSSETSKIMATFNEMIASTKGEVSMKVVSSIPLTEWELALLKKTIKERFYPNKTTEIHVETAVDDSLLGGFTVQIGDRFMDLSTRTELRRLTEAIGAP